MSRSRLVGVHRQWIIDENREERFGWDNAAMRIVHAKRARALRRRGEEVVDSGERTKTGKARFIWFVEAEVRP